MREDERFFVENDLRLTCADALELITDYLDDALAAMDLENFTTHLSLCEGCRVYVDQIRRTISLVGDVGNESVDLRPANFDALVARLQSRRLES